MAYDISTVAAAMDQKIMQLQHITNNLANASTPGFKRGGSIIKQIHNRINYLDYPPPPES